MTDQPKFDELGTLARTLYGEARSLGRAGMEDVSSVVMNRHDLARQGLVTWWGRDVTQICLRSANGWAQFSCWNPTDLNRAKLFSVTETDLHFALALEIARAALDGEIDDRTNSADHYCTPAVADRTSWAKGRQPVYRTDGHWFFRLYSEAGELIHVLEPE